MSSVDVTENAKKRKFIRKSSSASNSCESLSADESCSASSAGSEGGSVSVSESKEPQVCEAITDASRAGVSKSSSLVGLCWRFLCDAMLVTFIISTVLGVVHNTNQPKIRAAFRPRPFLVGPHVSDYYQGNVFQAFQDAGQFENSLLMFYAPWDRESQQARSVLLEVGKFFSETDILIAAVNCWYPTSDCAKEFGGKASGTRYPVFIFYPSRLKGIQYRGPVLADHLIDWVRRARYPLTPLLSLQHFHTVHSEHSSLLLGYLPSLTTNSLDINLVPLLQCSHHLLETDPATRVLVTSDPALARGLHLHVNHPVRLVTWNSTVSYPNKTVDGARCGLWSLRRVTRPASWLQLPARKSLVLSKMLGEQSLLVFSPRLRLRRSYLETAVTEVAARYSDCNSTSTTAHFLAALRSRLSLRKDNVGACQSKLAIRSSCLLRSFSSESRELRPACQHAPLHNVSGHCDLAGPADSLDQEVDFLLSEAEAERRHEAQYGEGGGWGRGSSAQYWAETDPVSGLGCKNNRSLNILMVDSRSQGGLHLLADSLGLDLSHLPALAVISVAEESLSLVSTVAETQNLTEALQGALLSWHSGQAESTNGLRSSDRSSRVQLGRDCSSGQAEVSCLQQVTRDNFQSEILQSNQSTVLLYTSSFCSQCSVTAHVVHSVNRILAGVEDIQFRMVDTTRNDLNWQFTALAYPSVIFFPSKRKENSRVFPTNKELNSTSLLNFILSNLSPEQRLRLALNSCDNNCVAKLKLHASHKLKTLDHFIKRRSISRSLTNTRLGTVLVKQIRHVRTVLYVLTALSERESPRDGLNLPQSGSQKYYSAIVEKFMNFS